MADAMILVANLEIQSVKAKGMHCHGFIPVNMVVPTGLDS